MDISVDENVIEKVKFRDILASLKSIVAGNKSNEDEKIIDKKLQEVYKVEKELGATDSITNLTKELEMHETPKKKRTTKNSDKGTKINSAVKENINSRNKEERQDEEKEL